jgi:hypothetical protein
MLGGIERPVSVCGVYCFGEIQYVYCNYIVILLVTLNPHAVENSTFSV